MRKILFNVPDFKNEEIKNINKLKKNLVLSSNSWFTHKCSEWLKRNIKCKEALLTHSCTAALEMCAILLNIKKNDEIIMPSFTFVTTANAFVLRGGRPVFVDIDENTCNIDVLKIEKAITKKTKAIVVVHYAGISCDMDIVLKIAKKHNLIVVEDAAQALLSTYKGKPLGSFGDLATLSFHETKNIHCGQGGALLINNKKFIKRAKIIRDKGTNRDLFNKNLVRKYTWVDYGSSYALTEINAAFLYSQFQKAKKFTSKRIRIFNHYHKFLKELEINKLIKRPSVPDYAKHNGHLYYIIIKNNKRDKLIAYLKQKKISSAFHYLPLHSSPFGRLKSKKKFTLTNTSAISKNLLRLPMHNILSKKDVVKCLNQIHLFFKKNKTKET